MEAEVLSYNFYQITGVLMYIQVPSPVPMEKCALVEMSGMMLGYR